ncbi:hypothetical protein QQY66_37835 [Streptomyces sp. DG2A-72]|uniref:hypothetical protein n=1 Tax=Streptomyces sp. DG2A-72 TaxID=3051386 RepID=UPI00265C275C|nr:hypothetical protein [Streptomyces sp. DG2A-72]MDO0937203.1 hypothetical protein [Streptomyces sp. DG2A-72]
MGSVGIRDEILPVARELLRRPPAHGDPQQLRKVQELLPRIGDPAVRDALRRLQYGLEERFGHDIGLGSARPVVAGGATDIALGGERGLGEGQER